VQQLSFHLRSVTAQTAYRLHGLRRRAPASCPWRLFPVTGGTHQCSSGQKWQPGAGNKALAQQPGMCKMIYAAVRQTGEKVFRQ
jgi:hypothetical protein